MRRLNSPGSYVQGPGLLFSLGDYCREFPQSAGAYLLIDGFIADKYGTEITAGFGTYSFICTRFGGECSMEEIERHQKKLKTCGVIFGIGGGKVQDTAKALAYFANLPAVIVPTAASSDAPCSRLAVLHHSDGTFDRYLPLTASPALVLADSAIIAAAPPRLLAAGMGDALATWYEAEACRRSGALTPAGARQTKAALALARECRDTVLKDGLAALAAAQYGTPDEALENVIEANTCLSGLGFEGGGLAAAHGVQAGLDVFPQCGKLLHGEKVAFGLVVQLILEDAPNTALQQIVSFCRGAKLPVCLKDLGIADAAPSALLQAAAASCAPASPMCNMPFPVTAEAVANAMAATANI